MRLALSVLNIKKGREEGETLQSPRQQGKASSKIKEVRANESREVGEEISFCARASNGKESFVHIPQWGGGGNGARLLESLAKSESNNNELLRSNRTRRKREKRLKSPKLCEEKKRQPWVKKSLNWRAHPPPRSHTNIQILPCREKNRLCECT